MIYILAAGMRNLHGLSQESSETYKGDKGLFDGIKPIKSINQGGIGAWESALRLSEANPTDGELVLRNNVLRPEVNGGKKRNLTLVINWYANQFLRTSVNYVRAINIDGGNFDGKIRRYPT